MNWNLCHVAVVVLVAASALGGERVRQRPEWQRDRAALDKRVVRDEFRIHYTLAGKNALAAEDQRDTDGDGVPDRIQNLALQLVTARRCYVEVFGLRHPFESLRYKGRVKFVEVNVWALPNSNGMAGDAVVNYHRDNDPPEGVEVLTIDLSAKLTTRNLSPAHELFHVFQNGYTLFKTPWYYEGVARWSEDLLRVRAGEAGELPASVADLESLFKLSYGASRFWQALARAADPMGRLSMPQDLRAIRYVGSDKPIIEDDIFHGARFLKALLEELDHQDDAASREGKLNSLDWPEARQRAAENNRYIWNAVIAACRRFPADSPQLRRMLELTVSR